MKEKFVVYKTTNLINSKYYIGVHVIRSATDSYLGSGKLIKDAIKKYGKENFSREILFEFETLIDALKKEDELITQELIESVECYNLAKGGGMPPTLTDENHPNFGKKLEWARIRMLSDKNPSRGKTKELSATFNKISVKDVNSGETLSMDKDDPRLQSGNFVHVNKGRITVRDLETNECYHVTKEEFEQFNGIKFVHSTAKQRLTCPYCGKVGGNSMKRWHFENCRDK